MVIRDLRKLHSNSMNKLRQLLKKNIRVIYSDNSEYIVPCTISDESLEMLKYNEYTGKDYKVFNILEDDLHKINAPIKNFMFVEYDREKYQVQTKLTNGIYDNTISLVALLYRGNTNG